LLMLYASSMSFPRQSLSPFALNQAS
jgi:hypothetical protein